MSDPTEKPSDLIPVTDFLKIIKFFDEGARAHSGVQVWTKENDHVAKGKMIGLSQSKKRVYTTALVSTEPKVFYDNLKAAGSTCFFNLKLDTATLFFVTKLQSSSPSYPEFTLPDKIFKVQRRQKQRFKILQGYLLRVTFRDPTDLTVEHKQKIYDVSSSGLSFLIDKTDPMPFQVGQVLKNLVFTLRNHEINLAGEIIQCKSFAENTHGQNIEKIKIGVMFLDIDPDYSSIIDDYVFEENRKFYSRFIS